MNYLLVNLTFYGNLQSYLPKIEAIMKTLPYHAKYGTSKSNITFNNLLIPYETESKSDIVLAHIKSHKEQFDDKYDVSISNILAPLEDIILDNSILVVASQSLDLTSDKISIIYSDGSVNKDLGKASYSICHLLQEDASGEYDYFTRTIRSYEHFEDSVDNGTNNIGELSGLHAAIKLNDGCPIKIIISDSEYSIKCLREWRFNWEKNGYKTYSKKPVENSDLIKSMAKDLDNSAQITLFKWVKGHDGNNFNELCDTYAKEKLNIK